MSIPVKSQSTVAEVWNAFAGMARAMGSHLCCSVAGKPLYEMNMIVEYGAYADYVLLHWTVEPTDDKYSHWVPSRDGCQWVSVVQRTPCIGFRNTALQLSSIHFRLYGERKEEIEEMRWKVVAGIEMLRSTMR